MTLANGQPSELLMAMADGIGEISFASVEWVDEARAFLESAMNDRAGSLTGLGRFTLCEVAHNPPAWLHLDGALAWHARFKGGTVEVGVGELADDECDFKVQGDHSIISNLARIQISGRDPQIVSMAQARLARLSRWDNKGELPEHAGLRAILMQLHDHMAVRTLPRFVFMTPEWVSSARHILTTRAMSEKYVPGLRNVVFTFSEEFTETPTYAFPDGSHGGFWVRCEQGQITVGAGPLPDELGPADKLTKGDYTPVVPVGRTVNAAMTDEDKAGQAAYSKLAFRFDKVAGRAPITQSSPTGNSEMPADLARVFAPLHDELSKRTSGELPWDYVEDLHAGEKASWAVPQSFDRAVGYDASWLRYNEVDIYAQPRK